MQGGAGRVATIFALSSGAPPAAIAIIRVSGPAARAAAEALAGPLPAPRLASRRVLRANDGAPLDEALLLWFPGPHSATGEDLAEFHLHGGRAVVAAVEAALAQRDGLRRAEPGEFTRRAFANGRIDLAEAEGLADLLAAETELQRRAALALAGGWLSRRVEGWRERVLALSAEIEAALDFDEEDEVRAPSAAFAGELASLRGEIETALAAPATETLREGFRVALAGPPNAGKSTLFNALLAEEAAIIAPDPGTTRDVLVRPVAFAGVPFSLVDMAGMREAGAGRVEAIGIVRAAAEIARADLVLWLGPERGGPDGAWEIEAQSDRPRRSAKHAPRHRLSAVTGEGVARLVDDLVATARSAMPMPGAAALGQRQRRHLADAAEALREAARETDLLLIAEHLRTCRAAFDRLVGRTATEDVLDALFGRFCIGK